LEAKRFGRIPARSERTGDRTTEEKQAFRYARGKKISYAILTNFERLHVFNADHERLILAFDYPREYLDRLEDLWRLSPEQVEGGSLPWWEGQLEKKDIDLQFLAALRRWRLLLANAIYQHNADNPALQTDGAFHFDALMAAVQRILDRLILVRYGDDKEVLRTHDLLDAMLVEYRNRGAYARPDHLMRAFTDLSNMMDELHNTTLFAPGHVCERVSVPNQVLAEVISEMNAISFRKFTSDILGNTYESYLGTKLTLRNGAIQDEERRDVRKGRGIYYTPRWVVEYIVDNTLGKRLQEIEKQHGLHAIEKVRDLAVLDPACGSGSFLIYAYQVLADFYRRLNQAIAQEQTRLLADAAQFRLFETLQEIQHLPQPVADYSHVILEDHLYGVDLDPEAAEIAAVNLTMQAFADSRREKLPLILNENIKVGNSLISGSEAELHPYFGDGWQEKRPFNWEQEFPEIMHRGGFDIVIGNPPYLKEYVKRQPFHDVRGSRLAKYYQGKADIWYIFACLAIDLLKPGGLHSFIATNNWITAGGASLLRQKVFSETRLQEFVDFGDYKVFGTAGIQTMIYLLEKTANAHQEAVRYRRITRPGITAAEVTRFLFEAKDGDFAVSFDALVKPGTEGQVFTFVNAAEAMVLARIESTGKYRLRPSDAAQGIVTPQDSVTPKHLPDLLDSTIEPGVGIFVLSDNEKRSLGVTEKEQNLVKPYYTTEELGRYYGNPNNRFWIIYTDPAAVAGIDEYPRIKAHLARFATVMTSDNKPYGLHRARDERFFLGEKIVSLRKTDRPHFTYTDFPCYVSQTFFVVKPTDVNLKYLVAVLNSSVCHFWLDKKGKKQGDALQVDKAPLLQIPIRLVDSAVPDERVLHDRLVALTDRMLDLHQRLAAKGGLPDSEREQIEREIAGTDREIDDLVYDLYGLTAAEGALVEAEIKR
jgi:adenine-specific DNA-methyltransferase